MSKVSDRSRLEFIMEMIEDIELPVKGSYDVRNFIAHDYEGVDLRLIDNILRYLIPELKVTIESLM